MSVAKHAASSLAWIVRRLICQRPIQAGRRYVGRSVLIATLLLAHAAISSAESGEAALKTAFLYNFSRYTEWPMLGSTFEICVVGKDELGEALDALARKEIAGRPVRIVRLASGEWSPGCNVLFITASESDRSSKLLASLKTQPVLTIADTNVNAASKPMLMLTVDQGRLSFDASPSAAQAAGLSFSAKLLRLARSVN